MVVEPASPLDSEAPEPRWRRVSLPCGDLDRAESAATAGDAAAAALFLAMAETRLDDALALAEAANRLPGGGMARLLAIARRLADAGPEPTEGYAFEFRCAEDGEEVSVRLTLTGPGSDTGAVVRRRAGR